MTGCVSVAAAISLISASAALSQVTFTFTSFDPPGSAETYAYSVNSHGNVVGTYRDSSTNLYAGYVRESDGTFTKPIQMSGKNTWTTGINDYGVISGYSSVSFTFSEGVFTEFPSIHGDLTRVNRINNNGDLTGWYVVLCTFACCPLGHCRPPTYYGFLYVASTGMTEEFPGGTSGYGLNKRDAVVGALTSLPAFLRSPGGTFKDFTFPGSYQTIAEQINDCGAIVGGFFDFARMEHGFYGTASGQTELDYPGSMQTEIDGINNYGELVGSYIDTSGIRHGFIATPSVPFCSL